MSLELIIGPMFAGKSSMILSRVRRARVLGWSVFLVTSKLDNRYKEGSICTHNKDGLDAVSVGRLSELAKNEEYRKAKIVIIEEGQFFPDLYDFVVESVENDRKEVTVVGLNGDSDRKPFGQISNLLPLADDVIYLSALCKRCGDGTKALFSSYLGKVKGRHDTKNQICVGNEQSYESLCRRHWIDQNCDYKEEQYSYFS